MKRLLLLICGITGLSACHHGQDPAPTVSPRTALLTANKWRVTALTTTTTVNGQVIVEDDFAQTPPCERDNFLQFNQDQTVLNDVGADKCSAQEPQSMTTHWAFDKDETHLLLEVGASTIPIGYIVKLSGTTFHLQNVPAGSVDTVEDITFTAF